ncbi:hypothetical protein TNCV_221871 [Trichonephila clavipes]|nr:hypothetical protein TNCV_221871 [Trichonephila clavipes]
MPIVSKYPNEIVTLDLVGPYPASRPERYKFILVITDHFTKWYVFEHLSHRLDIKHMKTGSDHQGPEKTTPEQNRGSQEIESRPRSRLSNHKFKRPTTSSPGVKSIAGPSKDCQDKNCYDYSRPEWKRTMITRPVRQRQREDTTNRALRKQSVRIKPIQEDLAHTIYGAVYKKKISMRTSTTSKSTAYPQHIHRRRSLSMEAMNGDPVHRI